MIQACIVGYNQLGKGQYKLFSIHKFNYSRKSMKLQKGIRSAKFQHVLLTQSNASKTLLAVQTCESTFSNYCSRY